MSHKIEPKRLKRLKVFLVSPMMVKIRGTIRFDQLPKASKILAKIHKSGRFRS